MLFEAMSQAAFWSVAGQKEPKLPKTLYFLE